MANLALKTTCYHIFLDIGVIERKVRRLDFIKSHASDILCDSVKNPKNGNMMANST